MIRAWQPHAFHPPSEPVLAAAPLRRGYSACALAVLVALGVWLLHLTGGLGRWDAAFYDRILAATTGWRETVPQILIVRTGRGAALSGSEQVQVLNSLHALGARAVVFYSLAPDSSRRFFERAAELKAVVFGRRLRPDPQDPDRMELEPWPAAASGLDLPWGVVAAPPALKGVYRSALAGVRAGTNLFPTLTMRTANLSEPVATPASGAQPFLISFVGPPGSIPAVSSSRLLAGELVSALVRGKAVLIGNDSELLQLETPVSANGQGMRLLEYEANTLQTLLDGTEVRPLPGTACLGLLLGLGIINCIFFQRLNCLGGLRLALGWILICTLASVVVLVACRTWIPLGVLALAQASHYGLAMVSKIRLTNDALEERRLHFLEQIKQRVCPEHFFSSPAYWEHLALMAQQTLEIERMVFLARVPRTQRLKEVKAFNCNLDELEEKERSLDAAVFSIALKALAPVKVTGLLKPREGQAEYLCPLVFSGEVYGIWLVGVQAAKTEANPEFPSLLAELSGQIGRLLHEKSRLAPARSLALRLNEWFSAGQESRTYYELRSASGLLEQYYGVLETLLGRISAGVVVYDCFGRALYGNEPAAKLFRAENCTPARLTVAEALRQLTGADQGEVRSLLGHVLLKCAPVSLSVKLPSQGERQFLLKLYPLSRPETAEGVPHPFHGGGFVLELIDTTILSNLASLKSVVADRLGVELRDHLGAIEVSTALLEAGSLSRREHDAVLSAIHQKISSCVHVLAHCESYLGRNVDACKIDRYPLDALELLNQVCSDLAELAAERRVTFRVQHPRLMDDVLASKTELGKLFNTAVDLLLRDAAENTTLTILVENAVATSTFRFSNRGFGIPNERLQEILSDSSPPDGEGFQVLREALGWARDWGGALEISSSVGTGYNLSLTLRHFRLSSPVSDEAVVILSDGVQETMPTERVPKPATIRLRDVVADVQRAGAGI